MTWARPTRSGSSRDTPARTTSARVTRSSATDRFRGKSYDTFVRSASSIVPADEVDPSDVRIVQRVNGEALQDSRTSLLVFGVAELIAYVSRVLLEPGDLILPGRRQARASSATRR